MVRKLFVLVLCFLLVSITLPIIYAEEYEKSHSDNLTTEELENDWYYLPGYPNYCPNGLPDFDQRQDETWRHKYMWSFCGPTALANVIWWFDSKHSDPSGSPGDGVDNYPLVKNLNLYFEPIPGPNLDDHNFNNINDVQTPWDEDLVAGELIEVIAQYSNINWYKIPFISIAGTDRYSLARGAKKFISDSGLESQYKVENFYRPSFNLINEKLRENSGIVLRLGYYIPSFPSILLPIFSAHYVAVAGVNSNGSIAICDPKWDITNPNPYEDPILHNDPSIVSHDVYTIDESPPYPSISRFWIPDFEIHRSVLVVAAIIISEVE